jgi:predicted lipoprotein with Yx(FWY)xxD motif
MPTTDRSSAAYAARSPWLLAVAAFATLAALTFALVNSQAGDAATAGPVVSSSKGKLGRILVDSSGRTLYLFEKDKNGRSACSGQCATFWPPLIANAKPRAGAGVKASLLGRTKRADGRMQVTYNHHPLYRFAKDSKRGQTNGEGLEAFGAEWYVVSSAGAKIGD